MDVHVETLKTCCVDDGVRRDFDDLRRAVASWQTRGDILTEPLYHRHENARFCTFPTFQLEDRYLTVRPRWCTYLRPTMNSTPRPLMNSTLTPRVCILARDNDISHASAILRDQNALRVFHISFYSKIILVYDNKSSCTKLMYCIY